MKDFENNDFILSDEQEKAKENDAEWTLITGGAGTGKTIALLERALWLLQKEKKNDPDDRTLKVAIISGATNSVKRYFYNLVENNFAEYEDMYSFGTKTGFLNNLFFNDDDDYCHPTYKFMRRNPNAQDEFEFLEKEYATLSKHKGYEKIDHILIDEAQDFSFAELYIIAKFAGKSLTLIASTSQDVFYMGYNEKRRQADSYHDWPVNKRLLEMQFGKEFRMIELRKHQFRCTRPLFSFANSLEIHEDVNPDITFRPGGSKPVLNVCRNDKHEYYVLSQTIRKILDKETNDPRFLSNIAVLTVYNQGCTAFREYYKENGFDFEKNDKDKVFINNIANAKGIEFKHVLIILESFPRDYRQTIKRKIYKNFYTAVTRATDHLEMFVCEDNKDAYVQFLGLNSDYFNVQYPN